MLKRICIPFILIFFTFSAIGEDNSNDIFSIQTLNRNSPLERSADDYYYSLTYVYSNVVTNNDDSFWKKVRNFFVDNDKKIVFQIQQEVKSGPISLVKASKVLSIFDQNQASIVTNASYLDKIISEKRFQNADSITLQVSLSEISKERASALNLILGQVEDVAFINSFTQGSLTLATSMINSLVGLTSVPSEKHKIATYTIHGVEELSTLEYVAIVARGDEEKFRNLINSPESIPKTPNELNLRNLDELPSYVLIKVNAIESLYSPTQILSANSAIRELVGSEIESIVSAANNQERAIQCVELRSSLNYLGPLTYLDEGYAAMAAMHKAKYNPEASAFHENEGCLTFEEIEKARIDFPSFKFGNCHSSSCRAANRFVNNWVFNRETGSSAKVINWMVVLNGDITQGAGSEAEFRTALKLHRRYGDIKAVDQFSYSVIGAMLGEKEGKTCVADVEATLGMRQIQNKWIVDSVNVNPTERKFDDGESPSEKLYRGITKC